jgi:hypothetical protein
MTPPGEVGLALPEKHGEHGELTRPGQLGPQETAVPPRLRIIGFIRQDSICKELLAVWFWLCLHSL